MTLFVILSIIFCQLTLISMWGSVVEVNVYVRISVLDFLAKADIEKHKD